MPLLFEILIMLVVVGFGIWLLSFVPIAEPYKSLIRGIILFVVIIFILTVMAAVVFAAVAVYLVQKTQWLEGSLRTLRLAYKETEEYVDVISGSHEALLDDHKGLVDCHNALGEKLNALAAAHNHLVDTLRKDHGGGGEGEEGEGWKRGGGVSCGRN